MLAIREAWRSSRRAPLLSALSICTIAFSLFAFGLFGLLALNIRESLLLLEDRVEIRVFLEDEVTTAQAMDLMDVVRLMPEVSEVVYVSRAEALARAREQMGEFRDVFESDFLPASLNVSLQQGMHDPATVERVANRLGAERGVEDALYGEEMVAQIFRLRNIAAAIGIALGALFALIAIMIIGATIRMSVLAREREIGIMRLVGATDWFIRRPFLLDGIIKGLLGGGLALLLSWAVHNAVNRIYETTFFDWQMAVAGVVAGGLLGLIGSMLSVGRQLRRI